MMLRYSLGEKEAMAIVDETGGIDISCRFCGSKKHYDAVDVKALFANADGPHEA